MTKELIGEFVGTFILVFIGCGSVTAAVIYGILGSLMSVAFVFGAGVSIAILAVRNICSAHLNPAVSFAMCLADKLPWKKFLPYTLVQMLGAFVAAAFLYWINQEAIFNYETVNSIVRGTNNSIGSAMIFGEFFPNPSFVDTINISWPKAMLFEIIGTFVLVYVIFKITESKKEIDYLTAIVIGATVMLLIILIAPYTQAGFNPARDFGPRVLSYFAGWGKVVFQSPGLGFLTVYILSPIIGAALGSLVHKATTRSAS